MHPIRGTVSLTQRNQLFDRRASVPEPAKASKPKKVKTSKYHKPDNADANVNAIIHAVSVHGEPQSFKQAMASVHQDEWWKAMETEYNGLIAQGTWELSRIARLSNADGSSP